MFYCYDGFSGDSWTRMNADGFGLRSASRHAYTAATRAGMRGVRPWVVKRSMKVRKLDDASNWLTE